MFLRGLFTLTLITILSILQGSCGNIIFVGPEAYYLERWREGGTYQGGPIVGVRGGYDYLRANCWYLGIDALYAEGPLKGKTGSGRSLKSKVTDFTVEGRLGYTFARTTWREHFFTPFGGYGYFREINRFCSPSPIPFTFTDTFCFLTAGFLSGVNFTPLLCVGINLKVRFMLDGKSRVTDDPVYDDIDLLMKDEIQVRVEVPLNYSLSRCPCHFEVSLVPFYEFRHFGGREGFPFDFFDTKFNLWGARLGLGYRF